VDEVLDHVDDDESTLHHLMARSRLPELDPMTFEIGDPREASVLVLVTLVGDVDTFRAQPPEERVEIVDAVVDHERGLARAEIRRVLLENRPHRGADTIRVITLAPLEDRPAGRLYGDAEMRAIPASERV
jgi:hypothetical protein